MTEWLIKHFVKNGEKTADQNVRYAYVRLTSITGMACNLFLFVLKGLIGISMNSISIISDGFNNLSDCLSCIVTLFGYKVAKKPADKEHPFGHGRMEYIVSFILAFVILLAAWELFKESLSRIMNPQGVIFSLPLFILLAISIFIKVWMWHLDQIVGNKIDSVALKAAAQDSLDDVMTTGITLGSIVLGELFPAVPVDGIAGVAVSFIIAIAGYSIAKNVVNHLLGQPASKEFIQKIKQIILEDPCALGVHDMIVHEYGPGNLIGSAHVEVDSDMTLIRAHDVADRAERRILEQCNVNMTLHVDPTDFKNPIVEKYHENTEKILKKIDPLLSCHDFRAVISPTEIKLIFDVLVPYESKIDQKEIKKQLDEAYRGHEPKIATVITFDHDFTD